MMIDKHPKSPPMQHPDVSLFLPTWCIEAPGPCLTVSDALL